MGMQCSATLQPEESPTGLKKRRISIAIGLEILGDNTGVEGKGNMGLVPFCEGRDKNIVEEDCRVLHLIEDG